jgi:hypothetical protein
VGPSAADLEDDAFWEGVEVSTGVVEGELRSSAWSRRSWFKKEALELYSHRTHSVVGEWADSGVRQALPLRPELYCRPECLVTVAGYLNKSFTTSEW